MRPHSPLALSTNISRGILRALLLNSISCRRNRVPCLLTRSWPSERKYRISARSKMERHFASLLVGLAEHAPCWIGVEVAALSRQTPQPLRPASSAWTVAHPRDFGNSPALLMFACRPETSGGAAPWHREDRNLAHERTVRINRAPVLTLWAAVVAERLGFDPDAALTLGRAVAGLNAHSKRVSLGLFEPSKKAVDEHLQKAKTGTTLHVDLMHRAVPVTSTAEGLRALSKDRPITPASVERYLESKFGENLGSARRAMAKLANSLPPAEIAARAYHLYEEFRPAIPAGVKGWGAAGELDLDLIERLSER